VTIRTDENDGRTHAISLTAKGRATHDQVIAVALERERRLLSCLRKDERGSAGSICWAAIHSNLDAVTAPLEP